MRNFPVDAQGRDVLQLRHCKWAGQVLVGLGCTAPQLSRQPAVAPNSDTWQAVPGATGFTTSLVSKPSTAHRLHTRRSTWKVVPGATGYSGSPRLGLYS